MRLAFVTRSYGQPGGGAEAYIERLARDVIDLGHELHVWTDVASHCGHPETRLHVVAIPRLLSVTAVRAFCRRTAREVRRYQERHGPFDVVVGFGKVVEHDVYRAGGGVHRRYVRTKPLPWLQQHANPLHRAIIGIEDRIYSPAHPTHIVCNSKMVRREIQEVYRLPDDKFTVIYNGVDTRRFTPERRATDRAAVRGRLGIGDDDIVLLFVGTGWQRKGLDVLVQAFARLRERLPAIPWTLCVVGRGDPVPYRRLAAQAGLPAAAVDRRLVFAGRTLDPECFYAAADVCVLPTRYDAGANVVQEALASGLPVITTTTNGTAELVTAEMGSVVDGHALDPEALAAAIGGFADPARRAAAGEAGRRLALGLRPIDNARRSLEVYERIAARKRKARPGAA